MQTSHSHEDVVTVAVAAIGADGTDAFHVKCADVAENEQTLQGSPPILELGRQAEAVSLEWQLQ